MRRNQDVWSTRVAIRRQSGGVEKLRNTSSPENLANACDVVGRGRLRLQHFHHAFRGAAAVEPNQRDVIFGRSKAGRIKGGFGVRQAAGVGGDGGGRRCDWIARNRRDAQVARGIDGALAVLSGNHNQCGVVQTVFLQLANHPADRQVYELDLTKQRRGWRSLRVQIAAHHGWTERLLD